MMTSSALMIIATFVVGAAVALPQPWYLQTQSGRVLGGDNALVENYPWQVSIEVFGHFNCSGIIVKSNYIATTATCANHTTEQLTVRSSTSLREKEGVVLDVDKVVPHEKWTLDSTAYDIAVMRVKEPFTFNEYCAQAELFNVSEIATPGTVGEIVGWGQAKDSSQIQMQRANFTIVEADKCNVVLLDGQKCVTGEEGKSACVGDAGSPFVVGRRIAGLASTGFDCDTGKPSFIVLTDIGSYRDWIEEHAAY